MTYVRVLSIVIAEFESGSDEVKYLSNSSLRPADLLNKATRDNIGIWIGLIGLT